jgi:Rps23 Pro-64 3,4-dihydroxylase Tpa1-like proline 4-hydroxylase
MNIYGRWYNNLTELKIEKYPFDHIVINDFLSDEFIEIINVNFPQEVNEEIFYKYENPLEVKFCSKNINVLPTDFKILLSYLMSPKLINFLEKLFDLELLNDPILHGGGLHLHRLGGILSPHLDYSIHPILKFQRVLNLILYLTKNKKSIRGGLKLYHVNSKGDGPDYDNFKLIDNLYNRAVIFNTTQNSWHGIDGPLDDLTNNELRKSFAIYYLKHPSNLKYFNTRALFVPDKDNINNNNILDICNKRADEKNYKDVYIINNNYKNT